MSTDNTSLEDILAAMDNDDIIIADPEPTPTPTPEPDPTPEPEPTPDPEPTPEPDPEPEPTPEPSPEPEPGNDPDPEPEPGEGEPNSLVAYYETLKEQGLIKVEDDYEFDGTSETFNELIEESKTEIVRDGLAEWFDNLQPDFQEVIRYALSGGQSMKDFVNSYKNIEDYSALDTTDEDHQLKLIRDYYKLTTNFDDKKIKRFIDAIEDSGDLEVEAIDAQNYLQDYQSNQRKALEEQQRQQKEAELEKAKEQRDALDEAIQSSSVVQGRRKNSIRAFLFNPIKRGSQTETDFNRKFNAIASNPEHMVMLADLLYDYSPEKGFNFSRYESKGKNKAAKDIKKALDQRLNTTIAKGRRTPEPTPDKVTDWETILNNLDF